MQPSLVCQTADTALWTIHSPEHLDTKPTPSLNIAHLNPLRNKDQNLVAKQLNAVKVSGVEMAVSLGQAESTEPGKTLSLRRNCHSGFSEYSRRPSRLTYRAGQFVLDVCASPGNKTTHLAAQMDNLGEIYSIELSPNRMLHWKQEIARSGCSIASPIMADHSSLPINGQVDVAMVDPPCSNTGVFARDPVSKWRVTLGRIEELSVRQSLILQAASEHVRPGGTLVYCTCSVLPEEDELIVEAFLKKNPRLQIGSPNSFHRVTGSSRASSNVRDSTRICMIVTDTSYRQMDRAT